MLVEGWICNEEDIIIFIYGETFSTRGRFHFDIKPPRRDPISKGVDNTTGENLFQVTLKTVAFEPDN